MSEKLNIPFRTVQSGKTPENRKKSGISDFLSIFKTFEIFFLLMKFYYPQTITRSTMSTLFCAR